ncbi:MAG: Crp/Fnr family transcriptional regulator [Pseudomonadota bacterium]|nr:MAG: hypothetical protein DIU78_06120 [Pseudomonadota bacterium]
MGTVELLARTLVGVEPEVLSRLARVAVERSAAKRDALFRAGEMPEALWLIQRGLVKLVRHTPRGPAICALLGASESIGHLSIISGRPNAMDAIAASDRVVALAFDRSELLEAMATSRRLESALARSADREMMALLEKIDVLSAGAVEARLATLLLKLNQRFGDEFADGTSEIPIPLSRRELAELVSTSCETVVRVFCRWEREGLVATSRHGFILHEVEALSAIAGTSSQPPPESGLRRTALEERRAADSARGAGPATALRR